LISEDLFNLPAAAMPVFTKTRPRPLPEMTLVRGSRIGLPSGQEACRIARVQSLPDSWIGFDNDDNKFLRGRGLNEKTPLWYYLLREAEALGIRRFRGGECLGPLGSRIVAEVLLGVMNSDPNHYLNVNPFEIFNIRAVASERRAQQTAQIAFKQHHKKILGRILRIGNGVSAPADQRENRTPVNPAQLGHRFLR
jgi:hypothetical protein